MGRQIRLPYVKDGINNYLVHGQTGAVNPAQTGTKAAAMLPGPDCPAGATAVIRLRLSDVPPAALKEVYAGARGSVRRAFPECLRAPQRPRRMSSTPPSPPARSSKDETNVMRQALAGMLWTKQYYYFDVDRWLEEHEAHPLVQRPGAASAICSGTT